MTSDEYLHGPEYNEGYDLPETFNPEITEKLARAYHDVLTGLGEDPEREGLLKTPQRVARSMQYLTHGYKIDPAKVLEGAKFKEDYRQMVLVKDIELYSLCEHHMIPFFGKAHVAYIPNGYITGLSKITRVVEAFSRRLQVQERLTVQIRDCIQETLNPMGVAVVIEARHLCMVMRGVRNQNSRATTSAFTGAFLNNPKTREEFIHLIGAKIS
ncbi:MAG: GTP cyclohydrolase I FolE [Bacteroidales bacterium]|nr:GTP cyclohydrolase I FolE [Bacteroidales bacterium]